MGLQYEDFKNKSKAEIENELYYLAENNMDLRNKIKTGKQAERTLQKNENRATELVKVYLGMEGKMVVSTKGYEFLRKEMYRADTLDEVQKDLKGLKDSISWSNYKLDQRDIFRILDNVDKSIEDVL